MIERQFVVHWNVCWNSLMFNDNDFVLDNLMINKQNHNINDKIKILIYFLI